MYFPPFISSPFWLLFNNLADSATKSRTFGFGFKPIVSSLGTSFETSKFDDIDFSPFCPGTMFLPVEKKRKKCVQCLIWYYIVNQMQI